MIYVPETTLTGFAYSEDVWQYAGLDSSGVRATFDAAFNLTNDGDTARIVAAFDGVRYATKATLIKDFDNNFIILGNMSLLNLVSQGQFNDTGEPFCIAFHIANNIIAITTLEGESHTFSVMALVNELIESFRQGFAAGCGTYHNIEALVARGVFDISKFDQAVMK